MLQLNDRFALALLAAAITASCTAAPSRPAVEAAPSPPPSSTPAETPAPPQNLVLAYTAERIWAALPVAYKAVGIVVNGVDSTTRAIGFAGTIRRELGGVRLSKYFRCGNQMGENADSYDVYIFIGSQVGREPESTRILVKTGLKVSARSPAFASTTTICTTTGELERRIHAALQAELRRSP